MASGEAEGGRCIGAEEAERGRSMAGDGRSVAGDRTPNRSGGTQPAGGALHPWPGGRMPGVDSGRIVAGDDVGVESTEEEPECALLPTLRPAKRAATACRKSAWGAEVAARDACRRGQGSDADRERVESVAR